MSESNSGFGRMGVVPGLRSGPGELIHAARQRSNLEGSEEEWQRLTVAGAFDVGAFDERLAVIAQQASADSELGVRGVRAIASCSRRGAWVSESVWESSGPHSKRSEPQEGRTGERLRDERLVLRVGQRQGLVRGHI